MAHREEEAAEPEKDRSERWLLTYADLITLMLIFFIILYVFSVQDAAKFKQMATSLSSAFFGTNYVVGTAPGPKMHTITRARSEAEKMEEIKEQVEELAEKQGLQAGLSVSVEEKGVVIHLADQILFNPAQANLSPLAHQVLAKVGSILRKDSNHYIRVEGHTDAIPIANVFYPSNWELSAARAASVARTIIAEAGINPALLSVAGYGEYRPVADNRTAEGRQVNRRVEIVILRSQFNSLESHPPR